MTEQERIRSALSGLHASGDTITEVLNMGMKEQGKPGRKFIGKRVAIVALAAVLALALGAGALAYSGVITSWSSSSNMADVYRALPTAQQAVRDAGYAPVLIGDFENGYVFDIGVLVDNALEEEPGGAVVEGFKSFEFDYVKDGDRVMLDQMRYESEFDAYGDVIAAVDGIDLCYFSYRSRNVAPDYQLTPEEQAARDAGEIVFSYGIEDPDVHAVQSVNWKIGNMHYALTQIDGALPPEELVAMAAEIIAAS